MNIIKFGKIFPKKKNLLKIFPISVIPEYHNYSNFSTIDAKHPFLVNLIKVRKNKMVTEAGKKIHTKNVSQQVNHCNLEGQWLVRDSSAV